MPSTPLQGSAVDERETWEKKMCVYTLAVLRVCVASLRRFLTVLVGAGLERGTPAPQPTRTPLMFASYCDASSISVLLLYYCTLSVASFPAVQGWFLCVFVRAAPL